MLRVLCLAERNTDDPVVMVIGKTTRRLIMPKWESLKAFRKERGSSVESLARQLGLSSDYVLQIENGQ